MNILLIEDNPVDVLCLQNAFEHASGLDVIEAVDSWDKALRILTETADHEGAECPGLILLDLNLPGKNGFEILEDLKRDARWRRIPVVVVSTSSNPSDVDLAYELQAAGYIVKPSDFVEYDIIAQTIISYWAQVVTRPGPPCAAPAKSGGEA